MKLLKKQEGFTLVELMVVVAIIGILSAVAIPNFKRYQAKSKQSEAKLQLSSIYTAETTLQTDYDSFATCLQFGGYIGPLNDNYYAVGFNTQDPGDVVANGGAGCGAAPGNTQGWPANKVVDGDTATVAELGANEAVGALENSFTAVANGRISADSAQRDIWTIDQNKDLTQAQDGVN